MHFAPRLNLPTGGEIYAYDPGNVSSIIFPLVILVRWSLVGGHPTLHHLGKLISGIENSSFYIGKIEDHNSEGEEGD